MKHAKNILRELILFSAALLLAAFLPPPGQLTALAATATETRTEYHVSEFGAYPNDDEDDSANIQQALNMAIGRDETITVLLDSGTYRINANLRLYSNTHMILKKDTLMSCVKLDGVMASEAHLHENGKLCSESEKMCKHGGHTRFDNITIEGGIWDQNKPDGSGDCKIFSFCHGRGVTLRNMTCLHCTNHFINMSATSDSLVENVTFKDAVCYTGDSNSFWMDEIPTKSGEDRVWREKTYIRYACIEALHLDYATKEAEMGLFPQDGTPCERITVRNCTFDNVFAGVGTHHTVTGQRGNNIVVEGCKFDLQDLSVLKSSKKDNMKLGDIAQACVNFYSFDDSVVRDCEVYDFSDAPNTRTPKFLRLRDSNAETCDNEIYGTFRGVDVSYSTVEMNGDLIDSTDAVKTEYGVMVKEKSEGTLNDVTIRNTSNNSVYSQGGCPLTCSGCTFENAGKYGICLSDGTGTFTNNNVINSANNGIMILRAKATVSDNTVTNAGGHGIMLNDSQTGCEVTGNTAKNCEKAGIAVYGTSSARILNNTISDAGFNAIWCSPSDTASCRNITITGNTANTRSDKRYDISLSEGVTGCTVVDNNLGDRLVYTANRSSNTVERNLIPMEKATFKLTYTTHAYTGKALRPVVTGMIGTRELKAKFGDFKVTYKNNLHVGKATVTITSGNVLYGKKVLSFKITKGRNYFSGKAVTLKTSAKKRTVKFGAKLHFPATVTYSSTKSKIKVNKNGVITIPAKFKGSFYIIATSAATKDFTAATKKLYYKVG